MTPTSVRAGQGVCQVQVRAYVMRTTSVQAGDGAGHDDNVSTCRSGGVDHDANTVRADRGVRQEDDVRTSRLGGISHDDNVSARRSGARVMKPTSVRADQGVRHEDDVRTCRSGGIGHAADGSTGRSGDAGQGGDGSTRRSRAQVGRGGQGAPVSCGALHGSSTLAAPWLWDGGTSGKTGLGGVIHRGSS